MVDSSVLHTAAIESTRMVRSASKQEQITSVRTIFLIYDNMRDVFINEQIIHYQTKHNKLCRYTYYLHIHEKILICIIYTFDENLYILLLLVVYLRNTRSFHNEKSELKYSTRSQWHMECSNAVYGLFNKYDKNNNNNTFGIIGIFV